MTDHIGPALDAYGLREWVLSHPPTDRLPHGELGLALMVALKNWIMEEKGAGHAGDKGDI